MTIFRCGHKVTLENRKNTTDGYGRCRTCFNTGQTKSRHIRRALRKAALTA